MQKIKSKEQSEERKIEIKDKTIRFCIGAVASLGIFAFFLLTQKQNPLTVYMAIVNCFIGNKYNVGEICVHMVPILISAIAALIPLKVGLSNCGGEGQLIAGALAANVAGVYVCNSMPGYIGIPIVFLAGIIGGMLTAIIPVVGKMCLNMNETLTTLLMNYIVTKLVAYLVYGPIKDPAGNNYPMSSKLASQLQIPSFTGSRGNWTIVAAMIIAVIVWFVFDKTELGFKLRIIGGNDRAAQFAGYKVKKMQTIAFMAASGLAGLGGAFYMCSVELQVRETTAAGYGFLGFLASGIVSGNALLAIVSSFMLSVLKACGSTLEMKTGLRSSASLILMSVILIVIFALGRRRRSE